MKKEKMTIDAMRKEAWNALKGKRKTMAWVALIYFGVVVCCAILSALLWGNIVTLIVMPPILLGMRICAMRVVRGEDVVVTDLFSGWGRFGSVVALNLVNGIFVSLWSLLLIVPGIIKSYAYSMSFYVLADHPGFSQDEAREESIDLMEGNKWRLFCLELSFLGWELLSILSFGVLYLWIIPYRETAHAIFYEQVKKENQPPVYIPIEEEHTAR